MLFGGGLLLRVTRDFTSIADFFLMLVLAPLLRPVADIGDVPVYVVIGLIQVAIAYFLAEIVFRSCRRGGLQEAQSFLVSVGALFLAQVSLFFVELPIS